MDSSSPQESADPRETPEESSNPQEGFEKTGDEQFESMMRREMEQDAVPVVCPVCGATVVREKCKLICRSEVCRGRIVMNCSEF